MGLILKKILKKQGCLNKLPAYYKFYRDSIILEKWEWQDEFDNWNEYSDEIQSFFHAAKSFGLKRVDFSVKRAQYQLNLLKKEQINKKTRVKRKVRQGQEDEQVNGE